MNIIALSIRRPVFAWVLMTALIVFGAVSMNQLGVSQMPDVDFPILNVSVTYEGASPEVVEADLIDPIEQQLLSIEGVKEMRSTVAQGSGRVTLEFEIDRNIDVALQEVQSALSQIRLPRDVDPPVIRKSNPEEQPIMFLGVASDKPMKDVLNWMDLYLLDQFRFIPGIGEVSIAGFSSRNLRIWPQTEKLRQADLTVADLLDAIETQHIETAAGQFTQDQRELRVRWLGEAADPKAFGEIRILRRGGQIIQDAVYKIKDVAEVEDGLTDIRRMARIDGNPAISISVRKQRGENEVEVAKAVHKKIEELTPNLPEGYQLRANVDFTRPTEAVVETTYEKLWVAALITILVCFLFLGSWQAALNILFSIPTSIVGTFIILYFAGFTLNLFSLLALTLAISIVVDDAIMLLENIVRHHRMGKSPAQAAYDGSIEILPAAVAATLAVVAVFLPVIFMSGVTGKFFFQFGVTMSAAVLLSLLEAVTITPMRAAAFLNASPKVGKFEMKLDHFFESFSEKYRRVLTRTLDFPKTIVFVSLAIFCVSLFLVKGLRQEFVPMQDQDIILLQGQTPVGSSLEVTSQKSLELEEIIRKNSNVVRFFSSVGAGGPNANPNAVFMPLYLKPRTERSITHVQVMDELREQMKGVKDMRVSFRDISARSLTSGRFFPVSFNITGPDLKVLQKTATEIMEQLNTEGLTQDLDIDFKEGVPELLMSPDRDSMAKRGVPVSSVSRTLNATVSGVPISRFTADGRRYDVRVKLRDEKVTSPKDIEGIEVRNNFGLRVPLHDVFILEERPTYQSISRLNRQRAVSVFGNLVQGKSQGAVLERARTIALEKLPDGYGFNLEGSAAGLQESFESLGLALIMGIVVAYMILAVQFNSFIHPISILIALPFSLTGALLTLWMFGVSLNLFSFIGIIVLMGIAKKNSILLVEFTNQIRDRGEENIRKALIFASPIRLRPILMTSVATIAAAMPLAMGNSIGQETRTPMGLTIIGGTILSTIFTLFVVPSLYMLLSKFESKSRNKVVLDENPSFEGSPGGH